MSKEKRTIQEQMAEVTTELIEAGQGLKDARVVARQAREEAENAENAKMEAETRFARAQRAHINITLKAAGIDPPTQL